MSKLRLIKSARPIDDLLGWRSSTEDDGWMAAIGQIQGAADLLLTVAALPGVGSDRSQLRGDL